MTFWGSWLTAFPYRLRDGVNMITPCMLLVLKHTDALSHGRSTGSPGLPPYTHLVYFEVVETELLLCRPGF